MKRGILDHSKHGPGTCFGHLTVVKFSHRTDRKEKFYTCLCSCGTEVAVRGDRLLNGATQSCGHLRDVSRRNKKLPNLEATRRMIFASYMRTANRKNVKFELSYGEFCKLIVQNCKYCGIGPSNSWKELRSDRVLKYTGIDKIDPRKGYESGNVVPCCKPCNYAKSNRTDTEFVGWARNIVRTWEANNGR